MCVSSHFLISRLLPRPVLSGFRKLEPLLKNICLVCQVLSWLQGRTVCRGRRVVSLPCSFWDWVGTSASMPCTSWVGGRVGNCREGSGTQLGLKRKATRARMGYGKCAVVSVKPEHTPEHIWRDSSWIPEWEKGANWIHGFYARREGFGDLQFHVSASLIKTWSSGSDAALSCATCPTTAFSWARRGAWLVTLWFWRSWKWTVFALVIPFCPLIKLYQGADTSPKHCV